MDRELAGDGRMLDVRDAVGGEERGEDVAGLAGLAGRQWRQRANGEAEVEGDAVDVASADPGTREDEQAMLGEQRTEFVDDGQDRFAPAVHDRAATDLDDLEPGQEWDRPAAGDGGG